MQRMSLSYFSYLMMATVRSRNTYELKNCFVQ